MMSDFAGYTIRKYLTYPIRALPSLVAQLVTCLTADTCVTAYPGVASSIPTWPHSFAEIYHEIISTAIPLPSADSKRVVVCYKQRFVHEVLVNRLVKRAQEKKCG